jgi:GntR family transcriptional regulator
MSEPMYRQIAEQLRQKIESGELSHGDQLPTELELREQYDASRNTIRDAVKLLITRGLVETRPGQGTFVVEVIDPFVTVLSLESGFGDRGGAAYEAAVAARSRKLTISPPRVEIQQASAIVAAELRLPEGADVVSRHQQRYIDETPWSLQTSFYPMRFVDQGATRIIQAADMPKGVVTYLQEELGIKQVGWRDKITVRTPDPNETAFFKLPTDGRVAVYEIFRTAFDQHGEPLRLTITAYPADRNQFVINIGQTPAMDATAGEASQPGPITKSFSGGSQGKDGRKSLARAFAA